jgi:hypothetical protein
MSLRVLSLVLMVSTSLISGAHAQSLAQIGAPAELPPASFTGEQYVDSRGCVFLRAGYGGRATWVARVGADRKPMCGYPPSLAAMAAAKPDPTQDETPSIAVVEENVPEFSAPATKAPLETIASLPAAPTPEAATNPAPTTTAVAEMTPKAPRENSVADAPVLAQSVSSNKKIGCYANAPVAERVALRAGGTVVICTRGDGTLNGWRPPIYPNGSGVGAALLTTSDFSDPRVAAAGQMALANPTVSAISPTPVLPGYQVAWKDDRLNPMRGKGTAEGWAQQDQVWTRDVPAVSVSVSVSVAGAGVAPKAKAADKSNVTVSTKTPPVTADQSGAAAAPAVAGSGLYIQVGLFGVVQNADGAIGQLHALGLPVARGAKRKQGKSLVVVMVGPLASLGQAQQALSATQSAGFTDAYIR